MNSPLDAEEQILDKDQQNLEESSTSDTQDIENTEESSTSEKPEKELSTFDLVQNALKKDGDNEDEGDESSSDEPKPDDKAKAEDEGDEDQSDEPSEEELKSWKAKTRERFQKLQTKLRDTTERLERTESDAGHYKQFTTFLEENRISHTEANELFNIGALMKNDPLRALEMMTPHYNALLEATGNVLTPDLQQQVQQGYITKQHALEISRHRALGQTNQNIQAQRQQHNQQQEHQKKQEQFMSAQNAVANWENNWSSSDPDYANKKDRVLERVELMLARAARNNQLPTTAEQAVALANQAKTDVEAELRKYAPKKAVQSVQGGSANNSLPEPKDTKDVIMRALAN